MHRIEIVPRLTADDLPRVRSLIGLARDRDGVDAIGEHKFLRVSSGEIALGVKAVLAYDSDRLVGYANAEMFPIKDGCRLSAEMVVHPDARRHGVASAMLEAIVKEARAQQVDRV